MLKASSRHSLASSNKPNLSCRVLPTFWSDYTVVVNGNLIEPNFLHTTYDRLLDVAGKHLSYLWCQDRKTKEPIPLVTVSDFYDNLRHTDACPPGELYQCFLVNEHRNAELKQLPFSVIRKLQENPLLWNGSNWTDTGIKHWSERAGKFLFPNVNTNI